MIDEIIKIIRSSSDKSSAIQNLITKLHFSFVQAEAIVNLRLYRMTATNLLTLKTETAELKLKITQIEKILNNPQTLADYQIKQFELIKAEFGDKRRTNMKRQNTQTVIKETDLIAKVNLKVFVSRDGYIKAQKSSNTLIEQSYLKNNDHLINKLNLTNYDNLRLITSQGQFLNIPLFKIPIVKKNAMGVHLNSLVKIKDSEKVVFATGQPLIKIGNQMLLTTTNGLTKQIDIDSALDNKSQRIMKIKTGDELAFVDITYDPETVLYLNNEGYAAQYSVHNVPNLSLTAFGVKAMNLKAEQQLVLASYIHKKDQLIMINEANQFKMLSLKLIKKYNRPVTGIKTYPKIKIPIKLRYGFILNEQLTLYGIDSDNNTQQINLSDNFKHNLTSKMKPFPVANLSKYFTIKNILKPSVVLDSPKLIKKVDSTPEKTEQPTNLTLNFDDLLND